jgi:lipoate-protein ligase A
MRCRYLADDEVTASFGLAVDEAVTRRQGSGQSPPTLRLYTYRSHCALVGRFQRVPSEVHLQYCTREGIAVNRRPTGGGAIIMGADQLGIAIMLLERRTGTSYEHTRELFTRFSDGITRGLAGLGVAAEFRRKNDVEVRGRKIAGLGIYFDPAGGLLFHASLVVDLDIGLMLRVLRTPFEKISDKEIATVAERVTTVRREVGRSISIDEVRTRLKAAYAETLGIDLDDGGLTAEELADVAALQRTRYDTPEWIGQEPATPDTAGAATLKTEGGLLSAHLTLAGTAIKSVYLTGDFFCDETVVGAIERALRWHSGAPDAIARTLEGLREREGLAIPRVPTEAIARVIALATESAQQRTHEVPAKGCFVNP